MLKYSNLRLEATQTKRNVSASICKHHRDVVHLLLYKRTWRTQRPHEWATGAKRASAHSDQPDDIWVNEFAFGPPRPTKHNDAICSRP